MLLHQRQASSLNTPGFATTMSNTGADSAATEDTSVPAATSVADDSAASSIVDVASSTDNVVTSAAQTSAAATSAAASQPASSTQSSQPAATQDSSSAAQSSSDASEPSSTSEIVQPSSTSVSTEAPSSTSDDSSDSNDSTTAAEQTSASTTVIITQSDGEKTTQVVFVTSTTTSGITGTDAATTSTGTSESQLPGSGSSSSGGLSQGSKVAIGVVVPIAAIAILALVGLFWWKKRRSRKLAEEERRKEVEDYAYNPNADPTIPSVLGDGYEMREEASSGYRGWGSTTINSSGRKASTTMSGGQTGQAYSDVTSPTTRGNMSDARSNDPLMDGSYSPEGEILGAMGPNAANNRGADVHRGPSNASSSYSAARSDGSDPMGSYGNNAYYDQYAQNNPYSDNYTGQPPTAPVIRDNPARRNTRIESPSHYPQQSAGISQNF